MTPFKDRDSSIRAAAELVCDRQLPKSVLFVVPPGFGEEDLVERIVEELRRQTPQPSIAKVAADQLRDKAEYLDRLHLGWDASDVEKPPPKKRLKDTEFEGYLRRLPKTRPFIQIVTRFHRLLDHLDPYILGSLREAEQDRCIQSIIIAPYNYDRLKGHWPIHEQKLTISLYGEKHEEFRASPLDLDGLVAWAAEAGYPRHLVSFAVEQTGGIPEAFDDLLRRAKAAGDSALQPLQRESLVAQSLKTVRRLVDHLDPPNQVDVVRAVANLHVNPRSLEDRVRLENHPWHETLINGDRLRSKLVGHAALLRVCSQDQDHPLSRFLMGRAAYASKRWEAAELIFATIQTPAAKLLLAHSRAMKCLYGASEDEVGVDAKWQGLVRQLETARSDAQHLGIVDELFISRYDELATFARAVANVITRGATRPLDALAGLDGRFEGSKKQALLFLGSQLRNLPNPDEGTPIELDDVVRALALPEQVLRVMAFWLVGLPYEACPAHTPQLLQAWSEITPYWRGQLPSLPQEGAPFVSLPSFAFLTAALMKGRGIATSAWTDLKELSDQLSLLDVRRDNAHAIGFVDEARRGRYLTLIRRWATALVESSGVEGTSLNTILAALDPLPGVSSTGGPEW